MERPNTTDRQIEPADSRFHFHGGNAPPLLRAGLHLADLTAGQRLTAILLLQIGQLLGFHVPARVNVSETLRNIIY